MGGQGFRLAIDTNAEKTDGIFPMTAVLSHRITSNEETGDSPAAGGAVARVMKGLMADDEVV